MSHAKNKFIKKGVLKIKGITFLAILALCLGFGLGQKVYGEDALLPSFGKGAIKVSLYTDYFCPPCRGMEPKVEPLLVELMKKGAVTVTFVDTPTSPYTSLFARYFVYALNANQDFEAVLYARNTLFEAAEQYLTDKTKLEEFLKERGIGIKPVDISSVLSFWNQALKEDDIKSTPTCVIIQGDKKEKFMGSMEILKALEALINGKGPAEGIAKNAVEGEKK